MIKLYFIALITLVVMSCETTPQAAITIHVSGDKAETAPEIQTKDSVYQFTFDSTGSARVLLAAAMKPGYGELEYGRLKLLLYLDPNKSLDLSLKFEGNKMIPEFSGEAAAVNEYLAKWRGGNPDFRAEEDVFSQALEDMEKAEFARIDTLGFDEEFVRREKQRIHYSLYKSFSMYPSYHAYYTKQEDFKPSPVYYDKVRTLIKEDEAQMDLGVYKTVLASFIQIYSIRNLDSRNPLEYLKATLDYVDAQIQNPVIASYLVNKFVTEYVSRAGIDQLAEFQPLYNEKVISPSQREKFEKLCAKWAVIGKGQASPEFRYSDIDGNEVGLSDLAGKYIFIDVWATWCGPCKREIPALRELEHQFKDKNITFVSISCDQNKAAWENMVKSEKLGGIQLHIGEDRMFMDEYMIRTIPRFILLDKEGKIITADMTRPSNPETVKTLEELEGL